MRSGQGFATRGLAARVWLSLSSCLILAGCGGGRYAAYGQATSMSCVPYARQVSGMPLQGDAWQWWHAARGRYAEASVPAPGSVLVFRRTGRLPSGHLAVVSSIVSGRQVIVDQANWVPYRITNNQPVMDVSPGNDWSAVRVWWPPSHAWGITVYPTYGFIQPRPAGVQQGAPIAQANQNELRVGS
ncbi:CHAP domain-containing protein [Acidisoma silvae]|uniref:CHAP domain-containing protein n=1 Tax=Acidisoma silvae TaxID=2802396 RepID=A0A963YQF5_9PROT|nr:CHAP domain-containing protein [Acidisoma silvae]MCB8875044.1 CHAP domain-containing protein [Acidisoma silvae]